jgi:hypothetical protein
MTIATLWAVFLIGLTYLSTANAGPTCPASLKNETLDAMHYDRGNLKFDWDGNCVVNTSDVQIAADAERNCQPLVRTCR